MGKINLTGNVYGKLIVLKDSGKRSDNRAVIWTCKCKCGNHSDVLGASLRNGLTKSCGKCRGESLNKFFKHKDGFMVGITRKGEEFFFDVCDFDKISKYTWWVHKSGYVVSKNKGKHIRLHRFIMNNSETNQVDHVFGNKLDNRRSELRLVTNSQNMMNRKKCKGKSKYKGVHWSKERNKWVASIRYNGKLFSLGRRETEEEAALLYNKKAQELFGEYAKLNII